MKKYYFFLFVIVLFIGMMITNTRSYGQNYYFEKEKDNFEININSGNYDRVDLTPKGNNSTKIAKKIEDKIYKVFDKIKSMI